LAGEPERKEKLTKLLDGNIAIMEDMEHLKELYPYLYQTLFRVKADLISKLRIAQESLVCDENIVQEKIVFFCSLREFERRKRGWDERPLYADNQKRRVDRYCLLGLLAKLPDEAIPEKLLVKAQAEQGKRNLDYRVQFYTIPTYTPEVLAEANEIARIIKEKGLRLNGIGRTSIVECFGEDTARRVYPQVHKTTEELQDSQFAHRLEEVLIKSIEDNGFTTTKGLYGEMHKHYSWKCVTQERISSHLPGLLNQHGLKEIQTNQELKAIYRIDSNGYPRIIVPVGEVGDGPNEEMDIRQEEGDLMPC